MGPSILEGYVVLMGIIITMSLTNSFDNFERSIHTVFETELKETDYRDSSLNLLLS